MQIRIISRLWFCRRPWRLKVDIRWKFVQFRKSNVRANKLDVQGTNFCFTQFYGSWSKFLSMQVYAWMGSRSRSLGFVIEVFSFLTKRNQQNQRCKRVTGKPVGKHSNQTCGNKFQPCTLISIWPTLITFHQTWHILVPMLCGMSLRKMNEAVIKMIIKGWSPTMRHVSRTHGVALDWLFDKINLCIFEREKVQPCNRWGEPLTSTFQECRIRQWNDHMASTFKTWFQKIENHPQRQALQSDLQQHRQFNPFSKESQDVIKSSWKHWTVRTTRCWT